jgi:hypothetical protein
VFVGRPGHLLVAVQQWWKRNYTQKMLQISLKTRISFGAGIEKWLVILSVIQFSALIHGRLGMRGWLKRF